MEQFFEFISEQWLLFVAFCVVLAAIIIYEARRALSGGKQLEPGAATQLYNREEAQFVDVRGDQEFRRGHLPGAVHLPQDAGEERLKRIKGGRPVIVYDDSGLQVGKAMQRLKAAGVEPVYGLRGGMTAWRAAGYPVEKK